MATVKETMMRGDAANNIGTVYMMSAGDTFEGELSSKFDEDWIRIEMTAGRLYTITLEGVEGGVTDTFLELYDSKGVYAGKRNDDIKGEEGNLNSSFQFIPPEDSTYYISAGAYKANLGQMNKGAYKVTVTEMAAGLPDTIEGTDMDDKLRGTDEGEKITGKKGNDSLFGLGGDDTLSGGPGNDLLVGGMGGDTLSGGAGIDTISYNTSLERVTINLTDGTARGGDADGDTLVDRGDDRIENVVGSGYDDVLTGNREANTLHGLGGDDTLDGDEGNDTLNGGAGEDVLDGGDEDDTLEGGPGADTLTGGAGDDTASYMGSMMGVEVRLHSSKVDGGDAKGDVFADTTTNTYVVKPDPDERETKEVTETVPDIVNLIGSGMADILAGDSRDNKIEGGDGDDMIFGGPGGSYDDSDNEDMLYGEGGNDKIYGGKGNDTLDGGPGNDLLVGGSGVDTFMGGAGADMIYADREDTSIDGGSEAEGAPPAMDTLSYAKFMDQMLEDGTGITLTLEGNTSVTNIEHLIGTSEDDELTGRASTGTGADRVLAPETIEGGDGDDELVGGDGPGDTVSYASSDRGVRIDLAGGGTTSDPLDDPSGGHASGDTLVGFENVTGSDYGDDLTARSDDTDTDTTAPGIQGSILRGLGGDDELEGKGGDDTLEGGAGADELDGGYTSTGTDDDTSTTIINEADNSNTQKNTLSYAGSDDGVTVNLATASASGGHADGDEIETYEYNDTKGTADSDDDDEIEVATFVNVIGSDHKDRLTGDRFDNKLEGGAGDDTLRGGAGADTLAGGMGADVLDGGEDGKEKDNMVPAIDPTDTDAEDGIDMIMEAASEDWAAYRDAMAGADGTGVTVNINTGKGTAGEAMGDTLRNIELYWGSKHNDTFIASAGYDVIHGDGGMDTVSYQASRHGVTVVLPTTDDSAQWTAAAVGDDGTLGTDDDVPAMFDEATEAIVMAWRGSNADDADNTHDTRAKRAPTWTVADAGHARPTTSHEVERDDGLTTTKSFAEGDILASIENVTGSRDGDVITGDGVPNVLKGGGGNDQLVGDRDTTGGATATTSDDTLYGGEGDDLLGRRTEKIIRKANDLNDDGDTEDAEEGQLVTPAINDDSGDDTMHGGPGNDTLYGGPGADTLNGGPGNDNLYGNNVTGETDDDDDATDIFVFTPDGLGSDEIIDFHVETDGTPSTVASDGTITLGTNGTGDKIDLSEFNIDDDDLPGLLSNRAGNVVLNLEAYGGGRVTIRGTTKEALMADTAGNHLIHNDTNDMEAGVGVGGTDGIFIL